MTRREMLPRPLLGDPVAASPPLRASADSSAILTTNAAPRLLWHIGTVPALSVNEPEAWKHHRPARKASDERMKSVLAAKGLRRRLSRPPGVHCEGGGQRGIH